MVRRQVCIKRTRNGGLSMPHLESHWLAERLAYLGRSLTGDAVWRRKASRTFPRLQSDPKAEGRRKPLGEALFVRECRKRLDRITFSRRWVNAANLVVRKGAMLESSFPPLPAHGVYGTGPSGPHPR